MDLRHVLAALRRRWYLPVVVTGLALLIAYAWMAMQVPMYKATAQVFVSSSTGASTQTGGQFAASTFAQARVASYAQLVSSPQVLDPVIEELGLPNTANQLAGSVSAINPPQTVLLEVTATATSGTAAAELANAAAAQLGDTIETLETASPKAPSPIKVSVTKPAAPPTSPYSPNPMTTLGLAGLLGLALGIGLALLREQFDTTIKTSGELAELSGATPLGVIGYDPDAETQPLPALNQQALRSESFRTIRTNLQYTDVDNPPKAVAITSSIPGEGKSTAACNLAITMAQAGLRVCLVEADLRRPRIAQYLGIDSSVGLTDVLAGRVTLEQALLPWNRYLLSVLPSGTIPPNPSELLASGQMRATLSSLRESFDVVIVDTAPLLAVADGAIASSIADGAILLVRHGRTTTDQLAKALDALHQVDAHVLGTVLNYAPHRKRRGYGYSYGGYGYAYGYSDRKKRRFGRKSKDTQTVQLPVSPNPDPAAAPEATAGRQA